MTVKEKEKYKADFKKALGNFTTTLEKYVSTDNGQRRKNHKNYQPQRFFGI